MMMRKLAKSLGLRENGVDGVIQKVLAGGEVRFWEPCHDGFASGFLRDCHQVLGAEIISKCVDKVVVRRVWIHTRTCEHICSSRCGET